MKKTLYVAIFLLSGCVALTDPGEKVQPMSAAPAGRNCKLLGEVRTDNYYHDYFWSWGPSIVLRNKTAALGGNAVVRTMEKEGIVFGDAYLCD
jgi:hypothetical protein